MPVGAFKSSIITCEHNTCVFYKVIKNPLYSSIKGVYLDCAGNTKYINTMESETIYNTQGERICTCDQNKLIGNWLMCVQFIS
jgi:hypothetical protein